MKEILDKQKLLMEKVPHDIRPESTIKMAAGIRIIESIFLYLNSTGHKPWRPVPLSKDTQDTIIQQLATRVAVLIELHQSTGICSFDCGDAPEHIRRQLISACGIIEETVEYMNNLFDENSPKEDRLEELTDILFFFAEQVLLSGFTYEQIKEQYNKKWLININRYDRAKAQDYSWDNRNKEKL